LNAAAVRISDNAVMPTSLMRMSSEPSACASRSTEAGTD
jgi:hypothetical protein